MADLKETSVDYLSEDKFCTVYTTEQKYMNKLLKLKEQYPNEVKIDEIKEKICGELKVTGFNAKVPKTWFKFVGPKRKVSDKQRELASERMRNMKKNKAN